MNFDSLNLIMVFIIMKGFSLLSCNMHMIKISWKQLVQVTWQRFIFDNCQTKTGIMTLCLGFIKVPAGNFNFFLFLSFGNFLLLEANAFYVFHSFHHPLTQSVG